MTVIPPPPPPLASTIKGSWQLCSLDEPDEVLRVRLRIVICDEDPGVRHTVDSRVIQVVASAHVGREGVLLALAVLAHQHPAQEDELLSARVGLAAA